MVCDYTDSSNMVCCFDSGEVLAYEVTTGTLLRSLGLGQSRALDVFGYPRACNLIVWSLMEDRLQSIFFEPIMSTFLDGPYLVVAIGGLLRVWDYSGENSVRQLRSIRSIKPPK